MQMTIGKVAERAGVGVETVRFYERKGLIDRPRRQGSAFRHYPTEAVQRIRFIKRAQDLGFTLSEIAELLDLRLEPGCTCGDIKNRAEQKAQDIDRKVRDLRRMKRSLNELISACDGKGNVDGCPILNSLGVEDL